MEDIMEQYKTIDDLLERYAFKQEYINMLGSVAARHKYYETKIDIHSLRESILSYQTKVKKKGVVKQLPLVDISPSMRRAVETETGVAAGPMHIKEERDTITISTVLHSPPVLPFKHCFIYNSFCHIINAVEIKDNLDGSYNGTLWISPGHDRLLIQARFGIWFDESWFLKIEIERKKRPLGQAMSNFGLLIHLCNKLDMDRDGKLPRIFGDVRGGDVMKTNYTQIAMSFTAALATLSSYKSKRLYKSNDIYVYTNGLVDSSDYIDDYPNLQEVDGWIVDGHWKTTKGFGLSPTGKPIKGLTWVTPYSDKDRVEEVVNGQVTNRVKNHAIQRAKERYNLDFTTEDLQAIANETLKGNATKLSVRNKQGFLTKQKTNISGCYRIRYKKHWLDYVLTREEERRSYRVTTFLPKPKDAKHLIIDCADYAKIQQDYLKD